MSTGGYPRDLVVLTADKNAQFAMRGLLERAPSLGIRRLVPDFFTHPDKDAGVLHRASGFLQPFSSTYAHAIVMMDRLGSGKESVDRGVLEHEIEQSLSASGWRDRAAAIVLDPELEIWVWSDSPRVDDALGWRGRTPSLRSWLQEKGFVQQGASKPTAPKEVLEQALRIVHKPRSSAIYQQLAMTVSVARCTDAAFLKLRRVLQCWFGETQRSATS